MNGLKMEQIKRIYDYINFVASDFSSDTDSFDDVFELRLENKDVDRLIYVKLKLIGIENTKNILNSEKQSLTNELFELEKRIFGGNFDEIC